jgi:hypothetical protein
MADGLGAIAFAELHLFGRERKGLVIYGCLSLVLAVLIRRHLMRTLDPPLCDRSFVSAATSGTEEFAAAHWRLKRTESMSRAGRRLRSDVELPMLVQGSPLDFLFAQEEV